MAGKLILRHSRPWQPNELIYVDGIPRTYTVAPEGVIVHFPGRESVSLIALKHSRRALTLPQEWRMESYT